MITGVNRRPELVRSIWCVSDPSACGRERRLPDADVTIVVNLAGDTLSWFDGPNLDQRHTVAGIAVAAPSMRPVGLDRVDQRHLIGVELNIGCAMAILGMPVDALTDPVVALEHCWGRSAAGLRGRLVDAIVERNDLAAGIEMIESELASRAQHPPDAGLVRVVAGLERGTSVGTVVDATGLSASTLTRRLRSEVGLAPKQVQRLARLGRVLDHPAAGHDWADVAARENFADQSHLIREFRELTGLTPGQYRANAPVGSRHVPIPDASR